MVTLIAQTVTDLELIERLRQRIGYSQMHVSRLLRRALDRLLHPNGDSAGTR